MSDSSVPRQTVTINVSGIFAPANLGLTSTPSATAKVGQSYSQANVATGGTAPFTYSLVSGTLPAGTTLDGSTGTVSGTPTTAGPFSYAIKLTDSTTTTPQTATQTVSGTILTAAGVALLTAACTTTPVVPRVGESYSATCQPTSGGTAPYSINTQGALPPGLKFSTFLPIGAGVGQVFGVPTQPGPFSFTVVVSDSSNPSQTVPITISGTFQPALPTPLLLDSTPSANLQAGQSYSQANVASGGTGPYTYALVDGKLPAGTALNSSNGTVAGTPTTAAGFSYTIKVTDSTVPTPQTATKTISGQIFPAGPAQLTPGCFETTPTPRVGSPYAAICNPSGGMRPYLVQGFGPLPPGLTLQVFPGGVVTVTGVPTQPGPYSYVMTVGDGNGHSAQQTISGTFLPAASAPVLTSAPAAATQVGQSYSQTNVATGGTAPYSYSLAGGAFPAGTALNASTGTVSGTPTTASAFGYTIKVTDSTVPVPQTATQTVSGTVAATPTTTSIASSANPSSVGQSVTFIATVTGGSSPTGTVAFFDGATQIGSATLSGVSATFATSALALGNHSITAKYNGNANNSASTSAALQQSVAVPSDSLKLRAMQIAATQQAAQISGQAISGAMGNAIESGFGDNVQAVTPNGGGFTFNFAADPAGDTRSAAESDGVKNFVARPDRSASRTIDDSFSALGYSGNYAKAPPKQSAPQRDWLGWIDVRGVSVNNDTVGADLKGDQVNLTAGLTRKLTPDFLVGILAGYEHLHYSSDALDSRLKGNGWTVGSYLGWRFAPGLIFDAGLARSGIGYSDVTGTAAATFPGNRWLVTSGLTGTYHWQALVLQPSAHVYALWEHDSAYTDSLGTMQAENNFSTGRASAGARLSYPIAWTSSIGLAPYAGVYGDYYFSSSSAAVGVTPIPLLQGWSARLTSGVAIKFTNGSQISAGGELGGLGGNTMIWTWRARGSVAF